MAKEPSERYPTAGALTEAARAALSGVPASRLAATEVAPIPARRRRGSAIATVAALIALLVVTGVVIGRMTHRDTDSTGVVDPAPASVQAPSRVAPTAESVPAVTAPPLGPGSRPSVVSTVASTTSPPGPALGDFVQGHYAQLPGDPAAAWAGLSPRYRDEIGGFDAYLAFWGEVGSTRVQILDIDPAAETVTYRLTLAYRDGRVATETRRIHVISSGGRQLIDRAELLS